jgi:hypothetical protein
MGSEQGATGLGQGWVAVLAGRRSDSADGWSSRWPNGSAGGRVELQAMVRVAGVEGLGGATHGVEERWLGGRCASTGLQ